MSAEILRRAAALMRERAESATPSPWLVSESGADDDYRGVRQEHLYDSDGWLTDDGLWKPNAEHIASWHPTVALAVADLLDLAATHQVGFTPQPRERLLAVARAYLGESA